MNTETGTPSAATDVDLAEMFREDAAVVRLSPGEVLFKDGDVGRTMYVVLAGRLTIRSGPVVYEDVDRGGIVGEMAIVESGMPRSAMVLVRTAAELVEIDEKRFLSLVASNPSFALTVMRVLSRRLRRMDLRYETARSGPASAV